MRQPSALKLTTAVGATLSALTLWTAPAAAQAADAQQPAGDAQPAAETAGGLAEIVVTAQKREESLQRAAIAVTAVSADALTRASVTNANQLTNMAPALQVNSTFGPTSNFYLRGVGNFVTNVSSDPAVIVNLDGVPLGRPTGVQGLFYDLQRVEVLKGPQGTLYGRNATGGAINVITAQPAIGDLSGYANVSYGNYDAWNANAAVNVPIGEDGAIRLAGMLSKRDGTYSDGSGDEDLKAFRFTMASQLTETLKATVGLDYAHMGGKGPGSTVHGLDRDERIGLNDPRAGARYAAAFSFLPGSTLFPLATPIYQDNDFWGTRLQLDLDTSLGTVSLIPAYRRSEIDMVSYGAGLESKTLETDEQTSVELRLVSPSTNRLQYIFGAFYFNETDISENDFNYQYASFYSIIKPKTNSYAAYGRLTYSVTPELRLNAGLRYTIDKRSTEIFSLNQLVICPGVAQGNRCFGTPRLPLQFGPVTGYPTSPATSTNPGGAFLSTTIVPNNPERTFKRATWRAGVEYDVGPQSLLYATVETGYKSGGFFSTPDPVRNFFKPERITAYTIGSKNRFFGNRLEINAEAFWWEYKDQQVSHFIAFGPTPVFATDNVGSSRMRGVEVEMRAQVLENTQIHGTVQYLDARNKEFTYTSAALAGPPITGCPLSGPNASGDFIVDCSGRRPANAPVWTLSGGIQQRIPLGDSGDLTFYASTRYQSGSYTGTELLPTQYQKGYFMSDLQLEYTSPGDKFSLAAFVNNVEDTNAVGFSQAHPRVGASLLIENLRMPRTYGVRAGVKF